MKTLQRTLAYKNSEIILRIQRALKINRTEALKLFQDVKSWLWLCARHREIKQVNNTKSIGYHLGYVAMIGRFATIDTGWHEFILMTRVYRDFCEKYLDGYIHHLPAPIDPKTLKRNGKKQNKAYLTGYLSFIEDELGPRRLKRWLTELPKTK